MINIDSPTIVDHSVVERIINSGNRPILFFDTCALLDILRIPLPSRSFPTDADQHVIEVKNFINADKAICLSSEICIKEFNDNTPIILKAYDTEFTKIESSINNFYELVDNSGIASEKIDRVSLKKYKIENYFADIAGNIISKIYFVEEEPLRNSAHIRLIDKIPPAAKKGEYKDCIIWETYYKIISELKSRVSFFISSNKDDYCDGSNTEEFHPLLKDEIDTKNNYFIISYTRLYHKLREMKLIK
ncbi:MAG: PIN domain-containing protein [Candidatus Cyclobacteriaceae bacterium M2_1C_046]